MMYSSELGKTGKWHGMVEMFYFVSFLKLKCSHYYHMTMFNIRMSNVLRGTRNINNYNTEYTYKPTQ